MTLKTLLAKNHEGVSFTATSSGYKPVHFKNGYFVALTDNEVKANHEAIIKDINKKAKLLKLKHYFYGYWQDQRTKKEYLDLSIHTANKSEALQLARTYNQKAIFNCKTLDSLYL